MNNIKSEPVHFAYIDALRGYAFLLVLLAHSAASVGYFPLLPLITCVGGYGVQLFFIISAFTLCNSLHERRQSDRFPVTFFFVRRFFRIVPLFWTAIAFYWLVPGVAPTYWLQVMSPPSGVNWEHFVLTALFLNGWHPYTFSSIVPGGWSIVVEMNFYVIFPLLFYYLTTTGRAIIAFVIVAVLVGFEPLLLVHFGVYGDTNSAPLNLFIARNFPSQIPVFLLGIILYQVLRRQPILPKSFFGALGLLSFCLLALVGLVVMSLSIRGSGLLPFNIVVSMTFAGMVFALSGGRLTGLVNPAICYIGKISYSCYLVHFMALTLTLKVFNETLSASQPTFDLSDALSNGFFFVLLALIALILTVAISTLTLHGIENPGIALGRKLIRYASQKASAQGKPPVLDAIPAPKN